MKAYFLEKASWWCLEMADFSERSAEAMRDLPNALHLPVMIIKFRPLILIKK